METWQKGAFETEQVALAHAELGRAGIDPASLFGVITGNIAAIDRLSRELLERVGQYRTARAKRERSRASKNTSKSKSRLNVDDAGQTKTLVRDRGLIEPSLVDFLITLMVEACAGQRAAPPASLAQLVRVHLGADTFRAQESKAPGAFDKAAQYRLAYPDASHDEIARYAGVSRALVSQWIKEGSLDQAAERIGRIRGAAELIRSSTHRP